MPSEKPLRSVLARYAVDEDDCIGCGLCHERAPQNIEVDGAEKIAHVVKQPADPSEDASCAEAAEYCPAGGLRVVADESDGA